jgi:hypothetical protein
MKVGRSTTPAHSIFRPICAIVHRQRFHAGIKAACHHPDAGNFVFPITVDSYGKPLFQRVFA